MFRTLFQMNVPGKNKETKEFSKQTTPDVSKDRTRKTPMDGAGSGVIGPGTYRGTEPAVGGASNPLGRTVLHRDAKARHPAYVMPTHNKRGFKTTSDLRLPDEERTYTIDEDVDYETSDAKLDAETRAETRAEMRRKYESISPQFRRVQDDYRGDYSDAHNGGGYEQPGGGAYEQPGGGDPNGRNADGHTEDDIHNHMKPAKGFSYGGGLGLSRREMEPNPTHRAKQGKYGNGYGGRPGEGGPGGGPGYGHGGGSEHMSEGGIGPTINEKSHNNTDNKDSADEKLLFDEDGFQVKRTHKNEKTALASTSRATEVTTHLGVVTWEELFNTAWELKELNELEEYEDFRVIVKDPGFKF
jgi:hypothetical protein